MKRSRGSFFARPSQQHHLIGGFFGVGPLLSVEDFHLAELPVGDAEYADVAVGRQAFLDARTVNFTRFLTRAVAGIDGELHHLKPVFEQEVSELHVSRPGFFCVDGEVEHSEEPHGLVFGFRIGHRGTEDTERLGWEGSQEMEAKTLKRGGFANGRGGDESVDGADYWVCD